MLKLKKINFDNNNAQTFLLSRYSLFCLLVILLLILLDNFFKMGMINFLLPFLIIVFVVFILSSFFINTNNVAFSGVLRFENNEIIMENVNEITSIQNIDINRIELYMLSVEGRRGLSLTSSNGLNFLKIITVNGTNVYLFKSFSENQFRLLKNQLNTIHNIQVVVKEPWL